MWAAVGPLSASLGLVSNAKRAVDVFKEMTHVPDEGVLLWRLLDATSAPLELSTHLATRHATMPHIEAAVAITRQTIGRCEQLLQRGEEEDDSRPESGDGWAAWFSQKKGGVERRVLVPQLCQNLQMCQQALQLGLTAIQVEFGPGSVTNAPFRLLDEAVDVARALIESFEMKRCSRQLLFHAEVWELAASATRKAGADWSSHGLAQISLRLQNELLCLEVVCLDHQTEADASGHSEPEIRELSAAVNALNVRQSDQLPATEAHRMVVLDDDLVFERHTLAGIVGNEMCSGTRHASSLAYKLSGPTAGASTPRRSQATALRFVPSCGGISAEIVEVLVQLCAMKQGRLDNPQLASVFDADSGEQAVMDGLCESLRMRIGPYEEDEPVGAGSMATPRRPAAVTPRAGSLRR